jgi:hypothetical protein
MSITIRVGVVAAVLLAAAGCSTPARPVTAPPPSIAAVASPSPSPSPSPTGEPDTYDGVKAAVDRVEAAYTAKDGGTAWDLLTGSGQATMSRADYIKVVQQCSRLFTSEEVLSIAMNAAGTTATVTATAPIDQGGGTFTWTMVYEGGHWKHQPSDSALHWMGFGATKALSFLRSAGNC